MACMPGHPVVPRTARLLDAALTGRGQSGGHQAADCRRHRPLHVTTPDSTALHFVCERPYALNDAPDPKAAQRIALLHKPGTLDAFYPQKGVMSLGTALLEAARSHNPDCARALIAAGASLKAPAFSPTYMEQYPEIRQQTVREYVLSSTKELPILYSAEVTKLFKQDVLLGAAWACEGSRHCPFSLRCCVGLLGEHGAEASRLTLYCFEFCHNSLKTINTLE